MKTSKYFSFLSFVLEFETKLKIKLLRMSSTTTIKMMKIITQRR